MATAKSEPIRFKQQTTFITHTFKLVVGLFKRHFLPSNVKPTQADWHNTEHVHYFHTKAVDGRTHTTSTSVGGHFHEIKIEETKDPLKTPKIMSISGPLKYAHKKDAYGKISKVIVPFNPTIDEHTHDIEYLHSAEIKPKTIHPEAAKLISQEAMKTAPVPGIQG